MITHDRWRKAILTVSVKHWIWDTALTPSQYDGFNLKAHNSCTMGVCEEVRILSLQCTRLLLNSCIHFFFARDTQTTFSTLLISRTNPVNIQNFRIHFVFKSINNFISRIFNALTQGTELIIFDVNRWIKQWRSLDSHKYHSISSWV